MNVCRLFLLVLVLHVSLGGNRARLCGILEYPALFCSALMLKC